MRVLLAVLLLGAAAMLASSGHAKTCKCEQHQAEASAWMACSRTESADYCTITFSAPDAIDEERARFEALVQTFFGGQQGIGFSDLRIARRVLYERVAIDGDVLSSIAFSSIPDELLDLVAPAFGEKFRRDNPELIGLVDRFNQTGCLQTDVGQFRISVIAAWSALNERCE